MHVSKTWFLTLAIVTVSLAAMAAAFAAPAPTASTAPAVAPKNAMANAEALGWKVGCQAYSFNHFSYTEAVAKTAQCGLRYIEIFPGQKLSKTKNVNTGPGMSDADIAEMKKIADDAGVKIINVGTLDLPGDEAGVRRAFEFCKKVGIETIVTEANESQFTMLDKYVEEYKINIALHNHAKPSHYWDPDTILKGIKGHSNRIGACADVGHWVRSGLNPVECLKKLEGHIISLHFKDLKDGHDVPWGTGSSDAKAMLVELKRQGFKGVFMAEYEYNWDNSVPDITKCAEWFDATAATLAAPAGTPKSSSTK
jgi:sugar phosphate isomerase/epimerase